MKTTTPKTLKVKFWEIPQGGLEFHFSNDSHELDETFKDLLGEGANYVVKARVDQLETMTQLKGTISALIPHICSRCAENFASSVSKIFTTVYYQTEDGINAANEGGLTELEGAVDFELCLANEIDLRNVFYEQLALEVPFQPLCNEDCRGLCGQCGVNLNTEKEHTHLNELMAQSPFAKLKELRGD